MKNFYIMYIMGLVHILTFLFNIQRTAFSCILNSIRYQLTWIYIELSKVLFGLADILIKWERCNQNQRGNISQKLLITLHIQLKIKAEEFLSLLTYSIHQVVEHIALVFHMLIIFWRVHLRNTISSASVL